jgi:hypothetical protein
MSDMSAKNLDLETLKHIKFTCDLYSDMSSRTLGYKRLCELIKETEQANEVNKPNAAALHIDGVSGCYCKGEYRHGGKCKKWGGICAHNNCDNWVNNR